MGSQLPDDSVMQERRARLAAERLLEKKTQELANANRKLSAHTVSLSDKIVHQRREVEKLTGENDQVNKELEVATHKIHVVERLLWDAIDTIQDGFAVYDSKLNLLAANPPYLRVFEGMNVGPGTDLHTILDLCVDEGLVDIQGMDGDSWCNMMVERWQKDEIEPVTVRFWNGIYVKMVDRRTSEGGIVSLVLNITDNVLREEELLEARDKAQAADRAKSAFLAKMSHELRTPMNGVVGMAELLLDGELDEEGELYASTIKNSGEALLSIINDVLDFSKIEAERIVLRPEPFDLERLVHDVGLIVDHMVQQKKLDFQVDYDQFLPSDFVGDAGRIRQILTNLIGNAVKFTSEGHVLVRIIGVPGEDETSCSLHVTVEDTGIGIDPAKVDHIFGEFNQIEDESNRKYEGTGLGLAITRKLVEQMGGEVWVHSVKGEGSCFGFVITLPVVQAGAKNQSQLPETVRKALVIEPNGLDLDILSRQLDLLGLQYRVFASAKAAAKYDEAGTADVIFVGHLHEILDGAETMDVLKEAFPTTPVVLMLSSNDAVAPDAADHVLQKPVHRKDLFDCLVEIGNADAAPTTDATERQLRVLAAEDNKTNQLVFKKMLKTLDLDLTLVWNGLEAVEAYGDGDFDMVFMDISMPEMDGMEASRTIRGLEERDGNPKTPIIAMTAHAMEGDEERIRGAGVTHYLTKPLKKEKIFEVIRELAPDNTNPFPED